MKKRNFWPAAPAGRNAPGSGDAGALRQKRSSKNKKYRAFYGLRCLMQRRPYDLSVLFCAGIFRFVLLFFRESAEVRKGHRTSEEIALYAFALQSFDNFKLILWDGRKIGYDRLLIATGANSFIPPIGEMRTANNVFGPHPADSAHWKGGKSLQRTVWGTWLSVYSGAKVMDIHKNSEGAIDAVF